MKKLSQFVLILCLLQNLVVAQNWAVFNKNYRYNYHFDNSTLVSNVLFADTFYLSGVDTVLKLNRVVANCTGSYCPTSTVVVTPGSSYIINMPQFLQREIIIKPIYTRLNDTVKLNIFTTCTVGATWKFDSLNNVNVSCINKLQQTTFGVNDSVKILLIGTNDTLKLSKHFGVLQWPQLYNANKYYRLTGVEYAPSYSLTPMYGERVPNAWDIYNYTVGDEFTIHNQYYQGSQTGSCSLASYTVTNKTIVGDSYVYTVNVAERSDVGTYTQQGTCMYSTMPPPISNYTTVLTYTNLSHKKLKENIAYPNQFIPDKAFVNFVGNNAYLYTIVSYYKDNLNNFYKLSGQTCILNASTSPQYTNTTISNFGGATYPNSNNIIYNNLGVFSEYFTTGFGRISKRLATVGGETKSCLLFFKRGGTMYFSNPPILVGNEEFDKIFNAISIYPNPANDFLQIQLNAHPSDNTLVEIYNSIGKLVKTETLNFGNSTTNIDIKNLSNGIYFFKIKSKEIEVNKKVVISK